MASILNKDELKQKLEKRKQEIINEKQKDLKLISQVNEKQNDLKQIEKEERRLILKKKLEERKKALRNGNKNPANYTNNTEANELLLLCKKLMESGNEKESKDLLFQFFAKSNIDQWFHLLPSSKEKSHIKELLQEYKKM